MASTVTHTPILVVMGVSGSGKSTLAEGIATTLNWDLLEGDGVHPSANIEKMSAGIPLTDEDRQPWLERIRSWIDDRQKSERPAIVTCSALKRRYRDILAADGVTFIHPTGDAHVIAERMASRTGHFMPASLLASQFATLEPLEDDEKAIEVDVRLRPEEQVQRVLDALGYSSGSAPVSGPATAATTGASSH